METNHAENLDDCARWRIVTGQKVRAQNSFVDGKTTSASDHPAPGQTASPPGAARSRSNLIFRYRENMSAEGGGFPQSRQGFVHWGAGLQGVAEFAKFYADGVNTP